MRQWCLRLLRRLQLLRRSHSMGKIHSGTLYGGTLLLLRRKLLCRIGKLLCGLLRLNSLLLIVSLGLRRKPVHAVVNRRRRLRRGAGLRLLSVQGCTREKRKREATDEDRFEHAALCYPRHGNSAHKSSVGVT